MGPFTTGYPCWRLLQSNRLFERLSHAATQVDGNCIETVSKLHPNCTGTARRSSEMKNPLDSLWGTIISGLVLTVILYFVVKSILS